MLMSYDLKKTRILLSTHDLRLSMAISLSKQDILAKFIKNIIAYQI